MNKSIIFGALTAIFLLGTFGQAFAQYMGNVGDQGQTGVGTLEETLELAKRRIEAVKANPSSGSGTPLLSADGVVGASIISAAVFGGIAGMLFFKGRTGKYAAQGRG
jgi:hypothetical protein